MSTWTKRLGLAVLTGLLLLGGSATAANAAVKLKVSVVHAQTKAGAKDPKLKKIQKRLEQAFGRYKSFKALSSNQFNLSPGKAASVKLPTGKAASFKYVGPAGKRAHKVDLKVGNNTLNLRVPEKRLFFQAGLKHQGGMLILAIYLK
jgi:hypothetical protein